MACIFNKSNATGATGGEGSVYPSGGPFFVCLSFFRLTIIVFDCDLRVLVTHSVSFSVSYCCDDKKKKKKKPKQLSFVPPFVEEFQD